MKLEINDIHIHISYLHKQLNRLKSQLINSNISFPTLDCYFDRSNIRSNRIFNNISQNLDKKLNDLLKHKTLHSNIQGQAEWIFNLSPIPLPQDVIDVVSLGQKFNTPYNSLSKQDILATVKNVENSLKRTEIDNSVKDEIRQNMVNNLKYYKKSTYSISPEDREFARKLSSTKIFLQSNSKKLFFTHADKGNLTVCLNKIDYTKKMDTLFSDPNTYTILSPAKNHLKKLQTSVHKILKRFNENEYLGRKYHNNELTQTDTCLAKGYGLPKIHKENIPLPPIISSINSPCHSLAKIVYSELKNAIPIPKSHINNSFELKKKLANITVPDGYIFASLDVCSLFTNISLEDVLDSLDRRIVHIRNKCKIPFDELREVVDFLYKNTIFIFNKKIYKQIFSSPMGSPLSLIC